jgi:hypothetical protein
MIVIALYCASILFYLIRVKRWNQLSYIITVILHICLLMLYGSLYIVKIRLMLHILVHLRMVNNS